MLGVKITTTEVVESLRLLEPARASAFDEFHPADVKPLADIPGAALARLFNESSDEGKLLGYWLELVVILEKFELHSTSAFEDCCTTGFLSFQDVYATYISGPPICAF